LRDILKYSIAGFLLQLVIPYSVHAQELWTGGTFKIDLKKGFKEIWRVLEDYGILTLKFNNFDVNFKALLRLFPVEPLYGTTTVQRARSETRWFTFMKIPTKSEVKKVIPTHKNQTKLPKI